MLADDCWVLWVCTAVGLFYVGKWTICFLFGLLSCLRVILDPYLPRRNLVAQYGGKWAAVTGSTDGIGKQYARQLARKGLNIILISRTPEKLKKVGEEIKKEYGVEIHTIAADFSNGRQIYDGIARGLEGKDIGILVNNVGFFGSIPTKFNEIPEGDIWRYLHVNAASVVAMTKLVLPQMLFRRRGAIINISSLFAVHPVPLFSVYSATKAFVTSFSKALEFEYRESGITVQTVQPGPVPTNMTEYLNDQFTPGAFMVPTATTFAYHALRSLGYARTTAGTWDHELLTFALKQCSEQMAMKGLTTYVEGLLEKAKKPK